MSDKKVLQPVRFVNAHYDFTAVQRDFIMLIQKETFKREKIVSSFKIDLKSYFKAKKLDLKSARHGYYNELCTDLLQSKISFKYFTGNKSFSHHNLFSHCFVDFELFLHVYIIDQALPLFYINKLEQGHFKDNQLVKSLFEQSYPEIDLYVAINPKTYIDFEESLTKKLYEKLSQFRSDKFRTKKTYEYNFGKDELYLLLGYGHLQEKEEEAGAQKKIFDLKEHEFIPTKYIGNEGWKNLRKRLNKGLKEISLHKGSGFTVIKTGSSFFKTKGRPIRTISITVEYDDRLSSLEGDQKAAYDFLEKYGLSEKQILNIVSEFPLEQVKERVHNRVVKTRDPHDKPCYGEYQKAGYPKINNVPGYIYGVVFEYGKKK